MKKPTETTEKKEYQETKDLQFLLSGEKFLLDCGHKVTIGHNFANTLIIHSIGGGTIRTACHECEY